MPGPFRGGVTLAVAMFTVVPLHARRIDRPAAAVALAVVPVVGVVLGALLGAGAAGLVAGGAPGLLAGLVVVGLGAAATRGLHLDGLADLADGLGSHGDAARTLAVMRDPGTGAFAVIWLVVVLGIQATAFGALAERGVVAAVVGGALALGLGRAAFAWVARRGVPAASPDGLGALVAGTQPAWRAAVWAVVLAGAAFPVLGLRAVVAALLAAVVVVLVAAHARRRLGGVSGDVFGACAELAATVALAVLAVA
ncbi:adenosylcobinamide-GDP ribazoletransferase [Actinomycetospora callitridis]|uniref:adenosylcobinamide-GDP ribazoletransferase n=1 Tax=Actinomycetospora callitridis TaxID=913944 RepID=UPI0023657FCF|nr:adenosylcobinamide-GDP ribazoletransferase [Actinomycetospora callitridis]MDD7921702.1 adenosylcobinamide-GDP ribazoletransferase [Actinomycetospora callitridis]